jgi:hypothetical protein
LTRIIKNHVVLIVTCITILLGVASVSGCAVNRPTQTPAALEAMRVQRLRDIDKYRRLTLERYVQRMKRDAEAYHAGTDTYPTFDILILSGGGDYGAFGAGFLQGWGSVKDQAMHRPTFDVVTGVSTGALIAPFALLGDDTSYERITNLYRNPKADWATLRDMLFFLPGRESFMSTKGLRRDLEREVDADVIRRIAEAEAQARTLSIGTTNLDLGVQHPWDLTAEAKRVTENSDPRRLYDILMASAAIPAAFPPVVIDGGLYVDGGTTSNILYINVLHPDDSPLGVYKKRYPNYPIPRFRYWVIINNQLGGEARVIQPTWISITEASVSTAIRASTIGSLRQLMLQAEVLKREGLDVQFHYVSIPDPWRAPKPGIFVKETMESLAELGRKMGADPASWESDLFPELLKEDRPNP